MLDEVAIFGEALTQQEIQSIMNDGFESALNPKSTHIEFKNKLLTHWEKIKGNYIKKISTSNLHLLDLLQIMQQDVLTHFHMLKLTC